MNARQAAAAAAKEIEKLEYLNMMRVNDIRDYNACIQDMIAGGDPCRWCEEQPECQRECKGKGCSEWWLRYRKAGETDAEEGEEPETDEATNALLHLEEQ